MKCIFYFDFIIGCSVIFASNSVKYSNIGAKIYSASYNANEPIEDEIQLDGNITTRTYIASIFDGHGGNQASQFAHQHLHQLIKLDANISDSIIRAYQTLDTKYLEYIQSSKNSGTTGSCGLTAVIVNSALYVGNAGDSIAGIIDNQSFINYEMPIPICPFKCQVSLTPIIRQKRKDYATRLRTMTLWFA